MELIKFEEYIKRYNSPLVVTIGSFDGIHLGHKELISKTVSRSKELDVKSAVITFDPHPLTVVSNSKHTYITSIIDKAKLISDFGIDYLIVIQFDKQFSTISKKEFVLNYLRAINTFEVIVGSDFSFGYKGEGKAEEITALSDYTIKTLIIDLIKYDNEKIGSRNIIQLLQNGEIEKANQFLSKNFVIKSTVIEGAKLGRELGFPTATTNISACLVKSDKFLVFE